MFADAMLDNAALENLASKILPTLEVKRPAVRDVMDRHGISEPRACELADLHRSIFMYKSKITVTRSCAGGCENWRMNVAGLAIVIYVSC